MDINKNIIKLNIIVYWITVGRDIDLLIIQLFNDSIACQSFTKFCCLLLFNSWSDKIININFFQALLPASIETALQFSAIYDITWS